MEPRFGFSRTTMPSKCPDCGAKMSEVKRGPLFGDPMDRSYRECDCGAMVVWSFPNDFKLRHVLPIFDPNLSLGKA